MFQPDPRITVIGDSFTKDVQGLSPLVVVQNFGRASPQDIVKLMKDKQVDLNFDVLVIMVGGTHLLAQSEQQLVEGIEQMILTARNKNPRAWILVSTLMYRPRDETVLKGKIDVINEMLYPTVTGLAKVGCRAFVIGVHKVLMSKIDGKLRRPIHVYFQDGFFPSKSSGTLIVRFIVRCARVVCGYSN